MHFDFFTYLVYSARGTSDNAIKSRSLKGLCKNGNPVFSKTLSESLIRNNEQSFFNDSILVPIPRSSPIVEGGVFPAKVIADTLFKNGISNGVSTCLVRSKAIPKSSNNYSADSRNSVQTHLDSLSVIPELISAQNIILVDDILTLGRTAMASAIKLTEQYPDKTIKIFCAFRTRSREDNNVLVKIEHQEMILSPNNKVILPD